MTEPIYEIEVEANSALTEIREMLHRLPQVQHVVDLPGTRGLSPQEVAMLVVITATGLTPLLRTLGDFWLRRKQRRISIVVKRADGGATELAIEGTIGDETLQQVGQLLEQAGEERQRVVVRLEGTEAHSQAPPGD